MKSISKKYYSQDILRDADYAFESIESISELKIGKDYAYSIRKPSVTHDINTRLTKAVFDKIPLNDCVIGFRKKYSYYDFLNPHKNNYNFLRLDVKSYFHSLRYETIKKCLNPYFEDTNIDKDNSIKLIDDVLEYCTYTIPQDSRNTKFRGRRILPIGFPSSPSISNIVFRQADLNIQKLCHSLEITYSRYADDLLFSSVQQNNSIHTLEFESNIGTILGKLSLSLNAKKTIRKRHTISLNGNVIQYSEKGGSLRLSNKKIRLINKITYLGLVRREAPKVILKKLFNITYEVHRFKYVQQKQKFFDKYCKDQLCNKLAGYRSYLLSIIQYSRKETCLEDKYYEKYSKIVKRLDKLLIAYQEVD